MVGLDNKTLLLYTIYNIAYIFTKCYNFDSTGTLCRVIAYKNKRVLFMRYYTNFFLNCNKVHNDLDIQLWCEYCQLESNSTTQFDISHKSIIVL